ncbi:MAG: 16S rRNA (cytosine(1402)-N(4))-methyltransferase RsmH, partial [Prevotellaceae bacterium]|nr:16S rRNA (cytosine(1402)-N(4))-methyltransferase RsmH [Prevotellaceae bacterium]
MANTPEVYHVPVLLKESVDGLNIKPGGIYVDVTFGGGGHSREILSRIGSKGHLFSFDQDADAENNIFESEDNDINNTDTQKARRFVDDSRFTFVRSNFRYLKNWMQYYGIEHIDGLLADLGVSSHHFDDESRGFSFRFDAPLDMRMNKRAGKTAADIINEYDEEQLADLFYLYGELKNSRRIAATLVAARKQAFIATTSDFIRAVEPLFSREREKKDMAKLFQALRIEVNHEMTALKEMLTSATALLTHGGRLSIITYHSLEDRIVKNVMKTGNIEGKVNQDFFGRIESPYKLINNKVINPSE